MNIKEIKSLLNLLAETDVTEFEYEQGDLRIAIRKGHGSALQPVLHSPAPAPTLVLPSAPAAPAALPAPAKAAAPVEKGLVHKSPLVGTFYRSPAPDAASFTEVGKRVEKGQTLCIVEAMKLMNEIPAEVSGVVTKVLVENGQPVEYGQALFVVDPG